MCTRGLVHVYRAPDHFPSSDHCVSSRLIDIWPDHWYFTISAWWVLLHNKATVLGSSFRVIWAPAGRGRVVPLRRFRKSWFSNSNGQACSKGRAKPIWSLNLLLFPQYQAHYYILNECGVTLQQTATLHIGLHCSDTLDLVCQYFAMISWKENWIDRHGHLMAIKWTHQNYLSNCIFRVKADNLPNIYLFIDLFIWM